MCGFSFLRHSRLYHLRLLFLVESGTEIGTANHLPLTGEPQKVVRTAEAGEECPYVSVRASRIGIYGHTSFARLQLVHAFKRASKLEDVFFSHAVSAFWSCSTQSASCYAYLHFATSRRRIRWSFSFGCKGNSGICRKSKVKPPVLREKSPALRVVFFPKNLAFPNPYLDGATETKTTDATGRRIKKCRITERQIRSFETQLPQLLDPHIKIKNRTDNDS